MTPAGPVAPAISRTRLLATVVLALTGLVVVGRLANEAWIVRPVPEVVRVLDRRAPWTPGPLLIGIVDGLRAEAVAEGDRPGEAPAMPFWRALAEEGVHGIGVAGEPTMTACCVRTILSGRNPDLDAAFRNFDARPVPATVVEFLAARGVRAAHAGDAAAWQLARPFYRAGDGGDVLAFPDLGPRDQGETDSRSAPFAVAKARDPDIALLTVHLVWPDHAGHRFGATGAEYRHACATVDGQLREIVETFRATRPDATILLTADHGVTPRGTHGGGEPGATRAPFALVGPRVARRIDPVEVRQASLAPTLCALLGLPMPSLAEWTPALEFTTLAPLERRDALDAYVAARIAVANDVGAQEAAAAADVARRAALAEPPVAAQGRLVRVWQDLEDRVFRTSGRGAAVLAVLLAFLWLAALVRDAGALGPGWTALALLPAGAFLVLFFAGDAARALVAAPAVGVAAVAASALLHAGLASSRLPTLVSGTRTLCVGGLVAVPAAGGAGLLLQYAFDATEDARPAAVRTAIVVALLVVAAVAVLLHRGRGPLLRALGARPGLIAAAGGGLLGFGLSLRLFVDPFVHTPILFAAAAGGALAAATLSRAARDAAPRAGLVVLGAALLVLVGSRVLEGVTPEWIYSASAAGGGWALAAAAATLPAVLTAWRIALRPGCDRASRAALTLAGLALASVVLLRVAPGVGLDGTLSVAHVAFHVARAAGLVALAATPFLRDADARLATRLLACVALATLFADKAGAAAAPSDAQTLVFALFALGALAASRLPAASTRASVAQVAVLVLAVRIAMFHALGCVESMGVVGIGAGVAPAAKGVGAAVANLAAGASAAASAPVGGWTGDEIENALHLAVKHALVWVVLFAALERAFARRRSPASLRVVGADLAVAFAARGAMLVLGMTVWWRSSWWVRPAKDVFVLALGDLVLALVGFAVAGAFRRSPTAVDERPAASRSRAVDVEAVAAS